MFNFFLNIGHAHIGAITFWQDRWRKNFRSLLPFFYFYRAYLSSLLRRRGASESSRRSPPAIYEWKSTHVSRAHCRLVVTCDVRYDYSRRLVNIADCALRPCEINWWRMHHRDALAQIRAAEGSPSHSRKSFAVDEENLFKVPVKVVSFFFFLEYRRIVWNKYDRSLYWKLITSRE